MKYLIFCLLVLGLASKGLANETAILGGLRSSSAETDIRGAAVSSDPDFQAGLLANLELNKTWMLRTGVILTQRQLTLKPTSAGTVDLNFVYVDFPFTALYRFSNLGGVFAGPVFAFNQSKDTSCTNKLNCGSQSVDAISFPLQLGVSFRFADQLGAEFYYEYLAGNLEKNVSNVKTVGANLLFYFE